MSAVRSGNFGDGFRVRGSGFSVLLALALLLAGCGGPRSATGPAVKRDAYYHRMITSGHAAFERGDIGRAAELYENAWVRARMMDRPAEIGASAYNLALCRIALGNMESGRDLLREARAELRRAGESGVDTLIAEAEVERRLGDQEAAWTLTDEVLEALDRLRARAFRVQTHSLRVLIALDRGDPETATKELALAEREVRRDTAPRLNARLAESRGRLRLAEGRVLQAAQAFDEETLFYRDEGRYPDMARAMVRAAAAYQEGGDVWMAVDRFYRAARHYAASGETVVALRLIERALPDMEAVNDVTMEQRVARLFEDLSESVKIIEE